MKSFFARVAFLFPALLLLVFMFAARAQAVSLNSRITDLRVDPQLQWPGDLRQGSVSIDGSDLVLQLRRGSSCPIHASCTRGDDGDVILRLHIDETFRDSCGAIVYSAVRHVDGATEKLTVTDNSGLRCFIRKPATEILFQRSSQIPAQNSEAYFKGEKLI